MADFLLAILRRLDMWTNDTRMWLKMSHRCAIHGGRPIADHRPNGGVFCVFCNK